MTTSHVTCHIGNHAKNKVRNKVCEVYKHLSTQIHIGGGDDGYTELLVTSNSHSQMTCAQRTTIVCTMGGPGETVAPTRLTSPRLPRL